MDKVKEYLAKFKDWHNEEVPYTKGDAVLQLVIVLGVIVAL